MLRNFFLSINELFVINYFICRLKKTVDVFNSMELQNRSILHYLNYRNANVARHSVKNFQPKEIMFSFVMEANK